MTILTDAELSIEAIAAGVRREIALLARLIRDHNLTGVEPLTSVDGIADILHRCGVEPLTFYTAVHEGNAAVAEAHTALHHELVAVG